MSTLKVDSIESRTSGNRVVLPDTNNYPPFRNIVINGDMSINQRVASSVTVNSGSLQYPVDRIAGRGTSSAGVFTLEQSTTAPDNFTNSVKATVTTNATPGTNDTYRFVHHIEGNYVKNLNWGSASAKTVTLSFKVRSSVTGTFGGAIINGGYDRFYNFSYIIGSADTWTDVSVTIPGDTSGTWPTDKTLGIRLSLSLGAGSGEVGSTGSWGTATYEGATGQTNLIETNGATWYITGLQFEIGDTATPFEFLPIDVNQTRCERYYQKSYDTSTAPGTGTENGKRSTGGHQGSTTTGYIEGDVTFTVRMRTAPTITGYDNAGTSGQCNRLATGVNRYNNNAVSFARITDRAANVYSVSGTAANCLEVQYVADAEI